MDYMDFYIAYDYSEADLELPTDKGPVFVLGKTYDPKQEMEMIKADVQSKIWCTYRR